MLMQDHECAEISRRRLLKGIALSALGAAICPFAPGPAFATDSTAREAPKKPLVVYFSHSGHTRQIAEMIHRKVGGNIVQIETEHKYPEKYNDLTEYAKAEKERNARPKLRTQTDNLDQYGVVFLGYPNWWSTMPMPVFTFLEQNRLDGRTIAPFATHGGGGLGDSVDDLKKVLPHARVLKPLAVNGSSVSRAEKDVLKWLEGLGPALIQTSAGGSQPGGAY